jgi:hypothetical protein
VKVLIAATLLILVSSLSFAEVSITASTGFINEHSALAEINLSTTVDFNVSASYGIFSNTQYIDAGMSYTYKRLTLGCAAAYLYSVPEKLSGHVQFNTLLKR